MNNYRVVGKRIPKLDGAQKAMGRAEYIQDIKLPEMLYGKILYSRYAHAKIIKMDISKAKALPGVRTVLTGEDVPEKMVMGFYKDNPPIKKGKVCSFRDEVAAVAAKTPEIAKKALDLIQVEYEELEGVFDPEKAMEKDSPLVHENHKSNVLKLPWKLHYGDVDQAQKEAAFVVEDRFSTTWVTHCCMGTSGALALFDAYDNLTIYSNTQIPSLAQKDFLDALKSMGLENKRVRVIKPVIGGAFGSKLDTYAYEHIAILLAHKCRKPVKITFNRSEEFKATSTRQPAIIYIKQGCDKNGKLLFRDIKMVLDNGAHTSWGATTPSVMMMPITSLYRVKNVRYSAKCVYTNNTYAQAMRGYGNPQATFAIESSMNMLAQKAGIGPIEFRRINRNHPGDITPQDFKITTCGLDLCLDAVEKELKKNDSKEQGVGIGVASLIHVGGGARIYKSDGCGAILKMDDYGKVNVFTGGTDMGQGLDNITAQIVAEELGLHAEDINVVHTDTDVCPWDVGAHASRSTFVAGNAALGAAKKIKKKLLKFGSKILDTAVEDLVLRDRHIMNSHDPGKSMPIDKLLRKAHFSPDGTMLMADCFYDPDNENLGKEFKGNMSMTYTFGVHGVKVKVDEETGKVEVLEYVAAHDVGQAINPLLLEGQVYGGVIMGLGYALTEEVVHKNGEIMNANFRDYKLFTAKDAVKIKAPILETADKAGPFGAKGIGEPGCVPTAPAVANAIYDAVGVRIKDLPITPEKVLAALQEKKKEKKVRLPRFDYLGPDNLEEALDLLDTHRDDAKILAGGTDLLVRMKKGLLKPKYLISLKALNELSYINQQDHHIKIGARTPIADIIASDLIKKESRALFQACEKIGAVSIQHYRGTIGGNILQDNRCHHYNQSAFYRSGRQPCHKDGGKICYAREEADRCNSTCQSDGATALMALGASITLTSKGGKRTVDLADFYTADGIMPFAMESHELLEEITIPIQVGSSAYKRLAYRSAIDYPIVCAGVLLKPSASQKDELDDARIVVGAMGRSPLLLAQASSSLKGKKLTDTDAFKKAADIAMDHASTFAVHNVGSTLEYRCAMVSPMVFGALNQAANTLKK